MNNNIDLLSVVNKAKKGGYIQKNQKKNKITFETEPLEFPESSIKQANMTIENICKIINGILREVINNFEGTFPKIMEENNNNIKFSFGITLLLKSNGEFIEEKEDKFNIIHDINGNDKNYSNETINKLNKIYTKNKINRFKLTKDGRALLELFSRKPEDISLYESRTDDGRIRINIVGLDIERFLPYIYGKKSKTLGRFEYEMRLTKISDRMGENINPYKYDSSRIVTITQYNEEELNFLKEKINGINRNDNYIIKG